jgi:hypothetical protein
MTPKMFAVLVATTLAAFGTGSSIGQTAGPSGGSQGGSVGSSGGSQATTTSTTTSSTGVATTTRTTHKHKAAASKKYKGEITSVDPTAKSFVVKQTTGDLTLKVNDKTKYSKGKTWDDVKVGGNVWGTYKNDGTDNWALSVYWTKAGAAKAPKTGSR